MSKTGFFAALVFLAFLSTFFNLSYHFGLKSSVKRDPAAVRKVYDFSHLEGESLERAMRDRILSGIELKRNEDDLEIGLGHFAFRNNQGDRVLACRE
ncbi:MAG: hypothetical protein N2578_06765, partial [Bdellovibrionaceae bacterium]|nr:hypothetical protein [Pseudobdellovibrionaceae bacterium]